MNGEKGYNRKIVEDGDRRDRWPVMGHTEPSDKRCMLLIMSRREVGLLRLKSFISRVFPLKACENICGGAINGSAYVLGCGR